MHFTVGYTDITGRYEIMEIYSGTLKLFEGDAEKIAKEDLQDYIDEFKWSDEYAKSQVTGCGGLVQWMCLNSGGDYAFINGKVYEADTKFTETDYYGKAEKNDDGTISFEVYHPEGTDFTEWLEELDCFK